MPCSQNRRRSVNRERRLFILAGIVLIPLLLVGSAHQAAADTGTLKLKVMRCAGSGWLSGAQIDVSVTRSEIEIDSATGSTNSSGYVEFTFSGLQTGDAAHVTVTPNGESPDSSHVYIWRYSETIGSIVFDVSDSDVSCSDYWYSEEKQILLCLYH
jgi:hypothetical protein